MPWIMGLAGSVLGIGLGCLWAANRSPPLANGLLLIFGVLPLFGFIAGFAPVARRQGACPVQTQARRLLVGMATAVMCAVGAYLSFVMASYACNKGKLPPSKQSVIYLIQHPNEVPELTVLAKYPRLNPPHEETWHSCTFAAFFIGGIFSYGFCWACSRGGCAGGPGTT
jgi:hypothetical protein